MRKIHWIFVALALLASCSKGLDVPDVGGEGEMHKVSFTFSVAPSAEVETKGEAIGTGNDDLIERIDLFEYDKSTGELLNYKKWYESTGIDIDTLSYTTYGPFGTYRVIAVLVNFDDTSIDYYKTLDAVQIGDRQSGIVPTSLGLVKLHRPLMGGVQYSYFNKDQSKTITLYRYISKFEIEKVTADFDDPQLFNSNVKLKSISFTGVPNFIRPFAKSLKEVSADSYQNVYGLGVAWSSRLFFGGINSGSTTFNDVEENYWVDFKEGDYSPGDFGATGVLAQRFKYTKNDNICKAAGELNIDLTGDFREMVHHQFGATEGILASSADPTMSHEYNANIQLYTINYDRSSHSYLYADKWEYQDNSQKLVIEAEIDGETNFYIVFANGLIPNNVYKIHNIVIKGRGSEYSNTYLKKVGTKSSVATSPVSGLQEIECIELGGKWDESMDERPKEECL